jgi:hypothetical protein
MGNCLYTIIKTLQNILEQQNFRPIGLWRWYINIAITILDIIHRPVFYLKLNSTL